jgi:endoglucanase
VGGGGGGGNGGVAGTGGGGNSTGTAGSVGLAGRGGSSGGGSGGSARGGAGGISGSGGTGGNGGASGGAGAGRGGGGGAAGSGTGPEPFVFGVPPAAAARFKKGINLGNRLEAPNEGDWGGTILAEDFPFIARRGFDHVRIPIRFSGHAQAASPYTIDATFFSRVDTVLDQATAANLAVVVDMHAYDDLASNVSSNRDRFVALWKQIAARYQSRPDTVAFELLNEPNTQLDTTWNDVLLPAIQAIRATNPRRLLIVDSVFWADPTKLSTLTLPNDANIMASIHLYEPKLFTFQGQDWMGPIYLTTGVVFPGPPATPINPVQAAKDASWANQWFMDYNTKPAATNPSGPATVTSQIALITSYRQSQGRTVYNGEWGPQDGGALDSRARLVTEVRRQCESAGIGWAIWEDPVNMNLFDSRAGTWLTAIIDALLPP